MKNWVRIVLIVGLTLVLWYLVANLTKSMTGGEPAPPPPAAQPQ